jgi:DNA mismatch repair protein MutS2
VIYPHNFEQKAGFDIIREMIREKCISNLGVQHVDRMKFSTDPQIIEKLLGQAEEFRQALLSGARIPSHDYFDMIPELTRLRIEGTYIEQEQLQNLTISLGVIDECITFIRQLDKKKFTGLHHLTDDLILDRSILKKAGRIIDDKGNIRDGASAGLQDIRRMLLARQGEVERRILQSLNKARQAGWAADDAGVTVRDGRLVIPVSSVHKRKIQGFIHDESATGQTVYIEPAEVLDANNGIRELQNAEKREIIRILRDFAADLRPQIDELLGLYGFLGLFDFISAKARFALQIKALRPQTDDRPAISWAQAYHPLLYLSHTRMKKPVVPLDIRLDGEHRILVISGPNAGGKSVCLKTIGLLQYMHQCGLLTPVSDTSTFGIFQDIFIEIGDEQSLEDDVSTYSSHLLNMKKFMSGANSHTLFLIDEFGSGTEPQLGGAIAEAILEKLNEKKALGVVTTHYSNLKLLAGRLEGVINGAMLFDTVNMRPMYQLKTGFAGSSFALEIADKIGFPKHILDKARKRSGKSQMDYDKELQQLEVEKLDLEKKQQQFVVADQMLVEITGKYDKLYRELESSKKEILGKAHQEALDLLSSANRMIEKTIREIREAGAQRETTRQARKSLKDFEGLLKADIGEEDRREKRKLPEKKAGSHVIRKGDWVRLPEQEITGQVTQARRDEVWIQLGSTSLKIQRSKVEKTDPPGGGAELQGTGSSRRQAIMDDINQRMANFSYTIDLRGKRGEEAVSLVARYLDEAILLNVHEVRILHGKGYGILRSLIHDYLKTVPQVRKYLDADLEQGGHGVTRVIFM